MSQTTPSNPVTSSEVPHVHAGIPIPVADTDAAPRAGGRALFGLLVTFALLAVGWYYTFGDMWYRWFPSWDKVKWSLSDRLTEGDSYYTHGPMVPAVSLLIAFLIYRKVGTPTERTFFANFIGGVALAASLLVHVLSVYARVMFPSGFALIGVLAALLLLWGGWTLLKAYWLPVAFLVFMVPLPMDWIFKLNFQLKFFAGESALWITNHIFKVPAIMEGATIILEPGPDGLPKELVVENVCGGLRSLISLICFAALFAVVCRVKGPWRIFMLLMAVPVAMATNIVRITSLNLVANYYGVDAAGPNSTFHDMSGLLVFIVALAMLFGIEQIILFAGRMLKRNWADTRLLGFLDGIPRGSGASPATLRPTVLFALLLSAGLSLFWSTKAVAQNNSNVARHAVPQTIMIDGKKFESADETLDELTLAILETNDYVYRRFFDRASHREADLLIVFSPDNRKGTHPPDVCLEGGGDQIVHKADISLDVPGPGHIVLRELVSQRGARQIYHMYIYKCGDEYTNSYWSQQFKIVLNGLTRRSTSGALIRFSVPMDGNDLEKARELGLNAARELMPAIHKGLN